jgi:hypothetical protein
LRAEELSEAGVASPIETVVREGGGFLLFMEHVGASGIGVSEKPTIILQNGGIGGFILEKSYIISPGTGKRAKRI